MCTTDMLTNKAWVHMKAAGEMQIWKRLNTVKIWSRSTNSLLKWYWSQSQNLAHKMKRVPHKK